MVARLLSSQSGETQVRDVYFALKQVDGNNPDVVNLGTELGYF